MVCHLTSWHLQRAADGDKAAGHIARGGAGVDVAVVGAAEHAEPPRLVLTALGIALLVAPAELGHGGHLLLLGRQHQEEHAQGGNGRCPLLHLHLLPIAVVDGFFFFTVLVRRELL